MKKMKISELKEIARKNGYEFSLTGHKTVLEREGFNFKNTIIINEIYENRVWIEASRYVDDEDMDMMEAAMAYAKTPPDDRAEKKKYYIISKLIPKSNFKYLCKCCGSTDELWFDVESNVDSKFIQTEIDEIKEKYNTDLKDFEIIEVEE